MKYFLPLFLVLFSSLFCDCNPNAIDPPRTAQEQYDSYLCRQEVRKAAQQLRTLLEKRVRENVPGFFQKIKVVRQLYPYIDTLEMNGIFCCRNRQTAKCCTAPLVEQLQIWQSSGLSLVPNEQ